MTYKDLLALAAAVERPSCSTDTAKEAARVIREYARLIREATDNAA